MEGRAPTTTSSQFLRVLGVSCLSVALLSGCGASMARPPVDYYFSNPILNHPWTPAGLASSSPRKDRREEAASSKASRNRRKTSAKTGRSAKSTEVSSRPAPPAVQPLRGNDLRVMRKETVVSAQRLVGIKDSFTQDSFLRHLLVVNNVDLGKLPDSGLVEWLYQRKPASASATVEEGDILFLGDGSAEMGVVVETVSPEGTVTFIGYWDDEVKRGVLSPGQPKARRDETSGRELNSFLRRNRLAGEMLLGRFPLGGSSSTLAAGDNVTN